MNELRRNLWVGVFVLAGLGALGGMIVLFGQGPTRLMYGSTYPLHIYFEEVSDIRPGNLVMVKGITIGRVQSVDLRDRARFDAGVDVVVAIERGYQIPEGSAAVTTEPVLGQGRPPVVIEPGPATGRRLEAGDSLQGSVRRAIDSIFPPRMVSTFETAARQIGDAAEALTPVLRELEDVIQKRGPGDVDQGLVQGNLSTSFARLDTTLKSINDVLGGGGVDQLRQTVANVKDMSEKGKKLMEDLGVVGEEGRKFVAEARQTLTRIDGTVGNLDERTSRVAAALVDALDRMDQLLDNLNVVGQQVATGQGNVGQLFMDSKLYESMLITAQRLSQAVEEFRGLIAEWREGKVKVAL